MPQNESRVSRAEQSQESPERGPGQDPTNPPLAKTVFDKALALVLLALTSPLTVVLAAANLAVGLLFPADRGPLLHVEPRISQGRLFQLLKFRIFKLSAIEEIKRGAVPKLVENEQANLTGVGRLLKKYGLDELPQLFNILRGEMSFVGPRPKPVAEYEAGLARGEIYRQVLRAGLAGPAQNLKGTHYTAEDVVACDFDYLEKHSALSAWQLLRFDLGILRRTVIVVSGGSGE